MRREKYIEERGRPFAKSKTRQDGHKNNGRDLLVRVRRYQKSREEIDVNQSQRVR